MSYNCILSFNSNQKLFSAKYTKAFFYELDLPTRYVFMIKIGYFV